MNKTNTTLALIAMGLLSCTQKNQYIIKLDNQSSSEYNKRMIQKIGISSLTLPNYLLKYPIAKREGGNKIEYMESHIWADRLDDALKRELIEYLQNHTRSSEIINYPWGALPDVSVEIVIDEFIAVQKSVILSATIKRYYRKSGQTVIDRFNQKSDFSGKDEDIAAAMSQLFGRFSNKLVYILSK